MCLIIHCPKGSDKKSSFLFDSIKNSANANRDGFGYAFKRANKEVYTNKGFMGVDLFIRALEKLDIGNEDELVIHLRMRSAGGVSPGMTHPFEVNYVSPAMTTYATEFRSTLYPLMFHNGTFGKFVDTNNTTSDTYNFVNKFMKIKGVWNLLKEDQKRFVETFKDIISRNKLVFLSKEADTILLGEFHEKNGYMFSNTSYENRYVTKPFTERIEQVEAKENLYTDNTLSFNTDAIKVDETNFTDFEFKAHCNSSVGTKVEKGDKIVINKWVEGEDNTIFASKIGKAEYLYISPQTLKSVFTIIPKPEVLKKYFDYIKLITLIPGTKSAVKKILNKAIASSGRKVKKNLTKDTTLNLKFGNKQGDFLYTSILMYLDDYKHLVDDYRLSSLLGLVNPSVKQKKEETLVC